MAFEFDRGLFNPRMAGSAGNFLVNQIARQVRPYWNGIMTRNFAPPPTSSPQELLLLAARGHMRPFDRALTRFNIENHLTRMSGGKSRCANIVRNVLGCPDLFALAKGLEALGRHEPLLVLDLLAGTFKLAALSLPLKSPEDWPRGILEDLFVDVASVHHAGNVQRQAKVAFRRLYQPTGHHQVDANNGALVTVRSAATALHREAMELSGVLGLEAEARKRELNPDEEAMLEHTGLVGEAEALEQQLREIYGDDFDVWYQEMMQTVEYWTRYIRRGSNAARKSYQMQRHALHALHGPSTLPALYLSLSYAVAWVGRRSRKTTTDETPPATSPLQDAVRAVLAGEPFELPNLHADHAADTRTLFFVLRNACVRDSDSFVHQSANKMAGHCSDDLIADTVEAAADMHRSQHEPLRTPAIATAARALDLLVHGQSNEPDARVIRGEMYGSILVQLQS